MRIFDPEYLLAAADSHERGGIPEPVRERESHGDRRPCDPGNGGEYAGGVIFCKVMDGKRNR